MRIRVLDGDKRDGFVKIVEQRGSHDLAEVEPAVRRIVINVRSNGDRALLRYAAKWDGLGKHEPVLVPEAELNKAWENIPAKLRDAIAQAAANIPDATASGRNQRSGGGKFSPEFALGNWCVPSNRSDAMFRAAATLCRQPY